MVRIEHARKARICALGCKKFLRGQGLDVEAFFRGPGIPAEELLRLDNAMVAKAVAIAQEQAEREGTARG